MADKLLEVQNIMLKNYLINMKYLEKQNNVLWKRVENLSMQFEKNSLNENFVVDMSANELNIVDMSNQKKLYKYDPYYEAEYKVSRFYPNMQEAISLISINKITKIRNPKYVIDSFDYVNEYINLIDKYNILKNKKIKKIGKYVFIGTLLGIHIEKLHKKINSKNYLIIEDSLEIFRLSLFFCNYKKIAEKSSLTFIVEESDLIFRHTLRQFLKNNAQYNHILKYSLASSTNKRLLHKLTEIIPLENPLLYSFSDYLGAYGRGIKYINDEYKILNFTKIKNIFEDKPTLYLGPGPSLSKHIEFIKKSQKYFVVICLASTLKLLSIHDIIPDIIISIDASTLIDKQFDVPKKYYKNSVMIVSSKIDRSIVKNFNKKNIYMVQDSVEFFEDFGILRGNSSGEIGYSLCCSFNIKELYLIGMDVALDQKTKNTHDKSYYINKSINNKDYEFSDFGKLDFDKDIIKVKGNFSKEVYTTRRYLQLIYNYNQVTMNMKNEMNIYNLSHGAFLEGMTPLRVENIQLNKFRKIKKKKLFNDMSDIFNQNSRNHFNCIEKKQMKKDFILSSKLLISLKQNNNKFNQLIKENPQSYLIQIIILYLELINPYVEFLNETEDIKNSARKIQKKQIKKLINFYKDIIYFS